MVYLGEGGIAMKVTANIIDIESAKKSARKYCINNQLDTDLLAQQRVFVIGQRINFAQPSTSKPRGLKNDLETQPRPTLIVEKIGDTFQVSETSNTQPYLRRIGLK